jgi:ankyrin repeat protein
MGIAAITLQGGATPLFEAAYEGYAALCKMLLDLGADFNVQDKVCNEL